MDWKNRVYCGSVGKEHVGRAVLLMGWIDAIRDHGNLLFIHLRDIKGIAQIVFNPGQGPGIYDRAITLKIEDVVRIKGRVSERAQETVNTNLDTGRFEVFAEDLEILSRSSSLPFQLSEKAILFGDETEANPEKVDEELRLKYRYLDLRRPSVQAVFKKRYEIIKSIRDFFHELGFLELETPVLTKSTPEGARDYLVPSRVHSGKFYALPQSPQLFKQLFMVGGMDRYFQIVRCFRDEDLRPNRQPEFTQMDMEASFVDEEFIYETVEKLICRIFSIGGIELEAPFPRMEYRDAIERYGTDRPDIRYKMAFEEVSDILAETRYAIFRKILAAGGCVKGFCIKGKADVMSKNLLQNEYAMRIVPALGGGGMTWMKVTAGGLESNIVQFFSPNEQEDIVKRFAAEKGDVIMMIADSSRELVNSVLCDLRINVAHRLGLIPDNQFYPLWVTEFPLFELKDDELSSRHHPFTMPERADFDPDDKEEMLGLNSRAYDLVMNGEELGGGSIRIHRMEIQEKIFKALGLSKTEIENKFGFFLKALRFGAPPHAGLALGMDRVIAMILNTSSIREVIAFPKNRSAFCPLTEAPSSVSRAQLKELDLGTAKGIKPLIKRSMESEVQQITERPREESEGISMNDVSHVARLARLRLTEEEKKTYKKDLDDILGYVEALKELDTSKVSPMSHVFKSRNVWRDDRAGRHPDDSEGILNNAPQREENGFKVPKILEG